MAGQAQQSTTSADSLLAEAERLVSARDLAGAQQACLRLLKLDRSNADAHFLLGIIAAELSRFGNAIEFIDAAITRSPHRADFHAHRARCLAMLKRDSDARSAVDRALKLGPQDALTLDTIGVVLSRLGDHANAVSAFRRAIEQDRRNPGFWFNLGSSLKFSGDFDEAERAYEAAIELSPRFYKAHSALSALRRQTDANNHIARLESLLGVAKDVDAQLHLRHALAKEYDDLGDYAKAFDHLLAGNRHKRNNLNYEIDDDLAMFDHVRALFTPAWFNQQRAECRSDEPIFVVGMPRTGTTLVERIITSHSQVYAAGELQAFAIAVKRLAGTTSAQVLDTQTLDRSLHVELRKLGRTYIDATRPATGHRAHFVDKMPLNFFYIGLIHKALPNAKIICLRRHPLDTCLSNFRQLFALKFSYYNYAYDLADIAHYYCAFDRLIAHWHEVLPGKVLEVRYEQLVADQEHQSRRIIEHCGLEWEAACLHFERNPSPVATASSAQVREPIYDSAIGRWRRYESFLGAAKNVLKSHGIQLDGAS